MEATEQRLFAPGDGANPPARTGREREEAVLTQCLADLLGGRAPPHNVALIGPRGTGKTVLLNWFERSCRERAAHVDVVTLTPDDIPTRDGLVDVLAPELTARCLGKPLAVLLDEAHTLDLVVGRTLLNASQRVRAEAPFLLVIAGTPGLPAHLGAMDASFWSRLGRGRLGIGLLSAAAAAAALVEPLAAHGVSIDPDALDAVVEHSQRYPYFIQLWGEALWEQRLATGATRLTAAHASAARPDVAVRMTDYYQDRYFELDQSGWLAAAEQVAARIQRTPRPTYAELKAAIADGLAPNADREHVQAALATCERLGFVWCPPGQPSPVRYEAGIPSLMTHVLDQSPATP